jgi:hypothetical protein
VGCETFWAVFNTTSRRPEALALPHEHFKKYPNNNATEKSFSKLGILPDFEIQFKRIVQLSDLDVINHANSVKYIEWCLDSLDSNLLLNQNLKAFEMNYMKEVSLTETLEINQHNNIFTITKEGKTCFIMELEIK